MRALPLLFVILLLMIGAAKAQTEWTYCAGENETCASVGSKQVRYGDPSSDTWSTVRVVSGAFSCNNATFGDPTPGRYKVCQTRTATLPVGAGPVMLTWTPPSTYVDGKPITAPRSYRVYRRNASGVYEPLQDLPQEITGWLLPAEPLGEQCYGLSAVVDNVESDLTAGACKVVRAPAPSDGRIEAPGDGAIETR